MKIAVRDLKVNPFRNLRRYPINKEKVQALRRSIRDTSFWDNLLARKGENGDYEAAYGVHRLTALRAEGVKEIDIPVRKLSDTDMARIMAHENMEEWGSSAVVEQETIRAVVEGYAAGKVELPKAAGGPRARYAPSFISGRRDNSIPAKAELAYTADTLANFLGWGVDKVEKTLQALATIEEGLVTEVEYKDLSTSQAHQLTEQTRRVQKASGHDHLAKYTAKRLSKQMKAGAIHTGQGKGGARSEASQIIADNVRRTQPKKLPPLELWVEQLGNQIADAFPTPRMIEKLDEIVRFRKEMTQRDRDRLIASLNGLIKRATRYIEKLEG